MNRRKLRRSLVAVLLSFAFIGMVCSHAIPGWAAQEIELFLPIIIKDGSAGTIPPGGGTPTIVPTGTTTPTGTLAPTITPTPTATATDIPGTNTTVIVGSNFFDGENITIKVGDTVIWQRESGFHNVVADDNSFRLGEPPDGAPGTNWETASFTFTEIGIVPYYCEVHGNFGGVGMSGSITVEAE